jgi:hypothetical protein
MARAHAWRKQTFPNASGTGPHLVRARFLRRFCEIFATLWIFLNRTAIQH